MLKRQSAAVGLGSVAGHPGSPSGPDSGSVPDSGPEHQ